MEKVKDLVGKAPILPYYDPTREVFLSVDASPEGLGAVLEQSKGPVAYSSATLTDTQKRYAHIEKELLAVVNGVIRFHQYLYGRSFKIYTDHKPLVAMSKKPLNALSARIQRLFLKIQSYDFELIYKPGREMMCPDALSRAPRDVPPVDTTEDDYHVLSVWGDMPVSDRRLEEIAACTKEDAALQTVVRYMKEGWPQNCRDVALCSIPYWSVRDELHESQGIILRNDVIVIPTKLRHDMLSRLHVTHQGIVNTKERARRHMYWPRMYREIDEMIQLCAICAQAQAANKPEPYIPHPVPNKPWEKVAIDFCEMQGSHYMVTVDYFTKYVEVTA